MSEDKSVHETVQKTLLTTMALLGLSEHIGNCAENREREGLAQQPLWDAQKSSHRTAHGAAATFRV